MVSTNAITPKREIMLIAVKVPRLVNAFQFQILNRQLETKNGEMFRK